MLELFEKIQKKELEIFKMFLNSGNLNEILPHYLELAMLKNELVFRFRRGDKWNYLKLLMKRVEYII